MYEQQIRQQLADLHQQHRNLDEKITFLVSSRAIDQLHITRLKRQKLKLKDWIQKLENELIPDAPA